MLKLTSAVRYAAAAAMGLIVVLALGASPLGAQTVLRFQQNGTDLTITAGPSGGGGLDLWRLVLDETKGVITEFYDLTSPAGDGFNFVSPYGFDPGLFAPFDNGIRQGAWAYAAGAKVDGQTSYTYTLSQPFSYGTRTSTVTINAPTAEGTWLNGITESTYDVTATLAQSCGPRMHLNAASELEMNAIYDGQYQDSLSVDGTLWSEVTVQNSTEAAALGLTPGRTFRLTALNLTNGTSGMDLDDAYALSWHNSFRVQNGVSGGIYNNAQSKPPAGTVVYTYVRLDIDIPGTAVIPNDPPVAAAGENQTVVDLDDNGNQVVHLDGGASYDPDGPLVGYAWTRSGQVILDEASGDVTLPVGQHMITLTVTDTAGATDSDTVFVTVAERVPLTLHVDQSHGSADDANQGTDPDRPLLTISAATAAALPGDTVRVAEGVYRESVGFASSGTADKPITLRAAPGERVIVAASDELTNWQPLTEALAEGNPHYANIYYTDLSWEPDRIEEDREVLGIAREPEIGWWLVGDGSTGTEIVDTVNLVETDPDYYVGATLYFRDMQPVVTQRATVIGYDAAQKILTLDASVAFGDDPLVPEIDRYYLLNKLSLLDTPGEYVLEDLGGGSWRLFVWPSDSGSPGGHLYEASRRSVGVSVHEKQFITIDGLEAIHAAEGGWGIRVEDSQDITVQNCIVHDNEKYGISVGYSERCIVRNNLSFENNYGITVGSCNEVAVLENDVHHNGVDGIVVSGRRVDGVVTNWCTNIYVERNYVHDHVLYGHPDNLQIHSGVQNLWYEDNAVINAGQSCMIEGVDGLHFVGNIIARSLGGMLHTGDPNNVQIRGNTLAHSGFGMFTIRQHGMTGIDIFDNIWYQGHGRPIYGVYDENDYSGDYNLFYNGPGIGDVNTLGYNGTSGWTNVPQFSIWTGMDTHSQYADPQFANAPAYWVQLDANAIPQFTTSRVRVKRDTELLAVGDHIELECDGIVRTITELDGNWVTFDPPLAEPLELGGAIANWLDNTDFTLDFTLLPTSPAIGAASDGSTLGSSINLAQYRAGDFNGDGLRDVPAWPPGSAPEPVLQASATADWTWTYENTPISTGGNNHILLTITIDADTYGNSAYDVTVEQVDGAGTILPTPTADPLVWQLAGGWRDQASRGPVTVRVTVTGQDAGGEAQMTLELVVRPLGDVNGDDSVGGEDKQALNSRLNGADTGYDDRAFDFNGDGSVGGADKTIMNNVLNGAALP